MNNVELERSASASEQLTEIVEEIIAEFQSGAPCDIEHYVARYPEHAERLRNWFTAMNAMAELGHSVGGMGDTAESEANRTSAYSSHVATDGNPIAGILGDFRILRELGRGGMGVVYEAEQISIGRRVALKVLPFAAMLDKQQLNRFKNEARAAGTLEHPNIVAIHSVGCERGVHYYAMQLIEGRSLAEVIAAMKPGRSSAVKEAPTNGAVLNDRPSADTAKAALSTVNNQGSAAFSSLPAFESREYFRAVAQLGIQAAEALDHAHQNGILHRDIKPANLLVDDAGKLWVTDFGLARIEQDAGMTMTGDLLGTLRYMSPEQALAKRVVVDHRSDIYSLGVTLYELLTLRPAYTSDDRQELLRQIAFEEPRRPRSTNSRIPQDLETIVLKASEKNPADRYTTMRTFADDLKRFLNDEPIKAKRQTLITAVRKWSRRRRGLITAATVTLVISGFVLAGSIGWMARDRAARRALVDATAASDLKDADRFAEQEKWPEALGAVRRAADVLASSDASGAVWDQVQAKRKDVEMVVKLDEIRYSLNNADPFASRNARYPEIDRKTTEAFRDYGIDVESLSPAAAAEKINQSGVRTQLVAWLESWARRRKLYRPDDVGWERLVEIAQLADPDPWRKRLRDTIGKKSSERKAILIELAHSADAEQLPLRTVLLLGDLLFKSNAANEAYRPLLAARQRYPDNFFVTQLLAISCPRPDDALRFCTAAQALRPYDVATLNNLGIALMGRGSLDEAESNFREAVRLKPDFAIAQSSLACVFSRKGKTDEAIAATREAIRVDALNPLLHFDLGIRLARKGLTAEAIASYQEAIRLDPEPIAPYVALAELLARSGRYDEAVEQLKQLQSKFGPSHEISQSTTDVVVTVLAKEQGRFEEARKLAEQALAAARHDFGPDHRSTIIAAKSLIRVYMWCGNSLTDADADAGQKLCEETLELSRRTLKPDLDPDDSIGTEHNLAKLLQVRGRYAEAYELYGKVLSDNRRVNGEGHGRNTDVMRDSASALLDLGRTTEAVTKLQAAIDAARLLAGEAGERSLEWTLLLARAKNLLGEHAEAKRLCEHVREVASKNYADTYSIVRKSICTQAWLLATANTADFRDGRLAVELATKACELSKHNDVEAIDTLAAAYAETGDFAKAVEWENKALKLIKNNAIRKKYAPHLDNFQAKKPWREPNVKSPTN